MWHFSLIISVDSTGKEVISSLLDIPQDDPNLNTVFLAVYKRFMEAVDAVDNGSGVSIKWLLWNTPVLLSEVNFFVSFLPLDSERCVR